MLQVYFQRCCKIWIASSIDSTSFQMLKAQVQWLIMVKWLFFPFIKVKNQIDFLIRIMVKNPILMVYQFYISDYFSEFKNKKYEIKLFFKILFQ